MRYKILVFLIAFAMTFSSNTVIANASDTEVSVEDYGSSSGHPLEVETNGNSFTAYNPSYKDLEPIESSSPTLFSMFITPVINETIYTDVDTLVVALRELCVMREGTVEVTCYCSEDDVPDDLNNYVLSHLYDETSSPKQGDYLYWNSAGLEGSGTVKKNTNGDWLYTISLTLTYRSTAAQEAAIDEEIADLLSSTGAIGSQDLKDNYSKVLAVYNYELDYYEYVTGEDNHSTYSAIINNQTVCQGYATAFYRLSRTLGVNSRVIASTTHGWNIAKIDDYYYLVDATWGDNPGYDEVFFLKGSDNFPSTGDHEPKAAYTSANFRATYPISTSDYVYNPTTEETTEETTEDTTEDTATSEDNTTEDSTTTEETGTEDVTTEDTTTEDTTTEEPSNNTTEETDENNDLDNSSVLYESDNIIIIREDYESTTETPYDNDEMVSTESWEEQEHEDPTYTVDTEVQVQTLPGSSVPQQPTTSATENSTVETEQETAIQIKVNTVDCSDTLIYENEDGITQVELIGYDDCVINFINETGLKEVDSSVASKTAIQAIQIDTNKKLYYAVKTKELGWLDSTNNEMTGVIGTDDYIVGIQFSENPIEREDSFTIIAGDCRDYVDYDKTPLYYTLHTDDDWDGIISNGAINNNGVRFNGIRISCDSEISYKVQQGGKWLKEVTNWVLAGNPFSDEPITGFSITGDDIIFRVQFNDGTWSDRYQSGQSIESANDSIADIQIYKK